MADVTVAQFAEVLKVPVDRLLQQLDQAGIKVDSAEDMISEDAKHELLTHLRRSHGHGDSQAEAKSETESLALRETFMKQLDVDADVASILVQEGFSTIEEIAYVPASELNGIEEFDEEIVKELRTRARDVLLTQAIASEESMDGAEPAADLVEIAGDALARTLARKGVRTRDDLADLAVDELVEMGSVDEKKAAELIMDARKHWFAEEAKV